MSVESLSQFSKFADVTDFEFGEIQQHLTVESLLFVDDNECKRDPHPCDVNARCSNTQGSYRCDCCTGYSGDGNTCEGNSPKPKYSVFHFT